MDIIAKLKWNDPITGESLEYDLIEGAIVQIGRSADNDIQIQEQHVSRMHARITYQDGIFVIEDLASANGVFVNEEKVSDAYPLIAGDQIRLFVPVLSFLSSSSDSNPSYQLTITNGAQEGLRIPLLHQELSIGRAVANATWEIMVEDASVSRPHAKLSCVDGCWNLRDLDSAYGTFVNDNSVSTKGQMLKSGDIIQLGNLLLQFDSN